MATLEPETEGENTQPGYVNATLADGNVEAIPDTAAGLQELETEKANFNTGAANDAALVASDQASVNSATAELKLGDKVDNKEEIKEGTADLQFATAALNYDEARERKALDDARALGAIQPQIENDVAAQQGAAAAAAAASSATTTTLSSSGGVGITPTTTTTTPTGSTVPPATQSIPIIPAGNPILPDTPPAGMTPPSTTTTPTTTTSGGVGITPATGGNGQTVAPESTNPGAAIAAPVSNSTNSAVGVEAVVKDATSTVGSAVVVGGLETDVKDVSSAAEGAVGESSGDKTITINPGDTLTSIAAKYPGVTVDEIAKLNGIADPNLIYAGHTLKIPSSSTDGGALPGTTSADPTNGIFDPPKSTNHSSNLHNKY